MLCNYVYPLCLTTTMYSLVTETEARSVEVNNQRGYRG